MHWLLRKVLELGGVLLLVSFGTFMLMSLLPGDPAVAILGSGHPVEHYEQLDRELGLDEPVLLRYLHWLGAIATGDLGTSYVPPAGTVSHKVMLALPVSLELALLAMTITIVVAVPLAMWSAHRPGGRVDRSIGAGTFGVLSVPDFLAGLIMIMLLVNQAHLFPRAEWVRLSTSLPDNLQHAFLPAVTISLFPIAIFTRLLRADLISTLQQDFILASRAKGMPARQIMFRDALRPASFTLITISGVYLGTLIGSTIIVENLFGLPGMGALIVSSANDGDVPVVQGTILVIAVIHVLANAMVDLSYRLLDPRIRRARA